MCEKSPNYAHALEYHPDHGGGTGTGRGLAEAFHKLGNQVIITGRTEATLQEACDANPGMLYYVLDCTDGAAIQASAKQMVTDYPALNVVINNAGVQIGHDFGGDTEPEWALIDAEISTNLLGVIRTSLAFLPHLKKQEGAALINVTSGLA
ncbi:MAG: SDR family NAD(P)-dependent oxidoreductase, partial [Bryobacteraceae bacterium]